MTQKIHVWIYSETILAHDDFFHMHEGAVPSLFAFPAQPSSSSTANKRKAPTPRHSTPLKKPKFEEAPKMPAKRTRSPSKADLKRKIRTLQQKVRRRDKKIETMKGLIDDLVEKKMISEDVSKTLEDNFSGLPLHIMENHFKNKDRDPRGQRHSDEVKRFALTLNFYSPKAYDYVRSIFSTFPHPSSLANWTSSVRCDPGLMKDVFEEIQARTEARPSS